MNLHPIKCVSLSGVPFSGIGTETRMHLCCPHCGGMLLALSETSQNGSADGVSKLCRDVKKAVSKVTDLPAVEVNREIVLTHTTFKEAAAKWVKSREPFVSEPTFRRLKHHLNPLCRIFGDLVLAACADPDAIREYQALRLKSAGADCINKEIGVLKGTLERAGLWKPIADDYKPLPLKASLVGRPLSEETEDKLFAAGATKEEWKVAYLVALLLKSTVMSPSEVFFRRIQDIDLKNRWIEINHGKTRFRVRRIPLDNADALKAAVELLKLAQARGATEPQHFLIPYRVQPGVFDPTRHAKDCRSAWRSLTAYIGERGLRMKDLKHHGATILDEKGVSRGVIHGLAGWSPGSRRMDTYSHVRMKPLREAVKLLERKPNKSA